MELGDLVIAVGLLLGLLMGVSACWVWLKHQRFGTGGAVLCLAGVALVGLSIYGRVSIRVGGLEAELEARIDQVAERAELVSAGVVELADRVEVSQRQFVALADALGRTTPARPQAFEAIAAPVEESVRVETEALGTLTRLSERGELELSNRGDLGIARRPPE